MSKSFKIAFLILSLFVVSCRSTKQEASSVKKPQQNKDYLEAELKLMYHEALKHKLRGDKQRAVEIYNTILARGGDNSAVYYELSRLYDKMGSFVKSLEHGEKALKLDPENKWYLRWMAILYKKNSYYEKAAQAFEILLQDDPKNVDYLISWSEVLYLSGQIEKTIEAYKRLEAVYGQEPELIIRRYQLYMELKQYENAVEDAKLLIKLEPDNGQYYQVLAETYESMGQPDKANQVYEELIEKGGGSTKIALVLAQRYFDLGENVKAIEALTKVYRDSTVDIDTKVQLLLSIYDMNIHNDAFQREKVVELLNILEETHPDDAKTYSVYGDYFLQKNDYQNAKIKFLKALDLDNSRFPIWHQILLLSYELNEFEDMFLYGNEALELFPSQPVLYLYKGIGALQTGRHDEAVSTLEYGKDLVFDNPLLKAEFYQNIGTAHYRKNEYEKAFKNFDESLKRNPDNAFLLNNYSYYLSLLKQSLDKALEMAKKANELIPNQSSFQDTYGWVFFQKEDYENALKWIEKAVMLSSESRTIVEHYGDVLYKLGRVDEAVEQWEKASKMEGASDTIIRKIQDRKYYE